MSTKITDRVSGESGEVREVERVELSYAVELETLLRDGMPWERFKAHTARLHHHCTCTSADGVRHPGYGVTWFLVADGKPLGTYDQASARFAFDPELDVDTLRIIDGVWAQAGGPTPARLACSVALG